jgi:rubrerythrin
MAVEIPSDPRGVLELALNNEKTAYDLFLEAREKSSSDLAKHTFQFLCDEETRHMKAINEYFQALEQGREPDAVEEFHSLDHAKRQLASIFASFKADVEAATMAREQHLAAYEVALDIETIGYQFYKQAASQAGTDFAKRFYTWLMNEENAHYDLISQTYDFLKHPDGFMAEMERWMQT